jgi:hypothetical protein
LKAKIEDAKAISYPVGRREWKAKLPRSRAAKEERLSRTPR